MNLVNKEVSHKHFGKGRIIQVNEESVEVHFDIGNKKFVYPDAFGRFLTLLDLEAAQSIEKIIHKKEEEQKQKKLLIQQEKQRHWEQQQLQLRQKKILKEQKLHPQSQVVFWCNDDEQNRVFKEWQVFTGVIKSGKNKGTPRKLSRLQPGSACLLTKRAADAPEHERQIIGVYMVEENFIGKLRDDGIIPAHTTYRLKLSEKEAKQMLFWNYYINEKYPNNMTWRTGKFRYFDNIWMAQILRDLVSLKSNTKEKEFAQQFFEYFCKMNQINYGEIPQPNGALMQNHQ